MHVFDLCDLQFSLMHMFIRSDDVQITQGMHWFVNRSVNSEMQLTQN